MSIENKRMQQRYGTYQEFQTYKNTLLPNEFAIVTSGCPDTEDGQAVYIKIGSSTVPKRLLTDVNLSSLISTSISERVLYYIKSCVESLYPDWTITHQYQAITSSSSLYIDGTAEFSVANFNPVLDGVIIYIHSNDIYMMPDPQNYTVTATASTVTITFDTQVVDFEEGQRVEFYFYQKPPTIPIAPPMTQAEYDLITPIEGTLYIIIPESAGGTT